MVRPIACLAAALLLAGGRTSRPADTACPAAFAAIDADIDARQGEGEAARAALVRRLDALLRREGATASECARGALNQTLRLELLDGHYESVIARSDAFASGPLHDEYPDTDAMLYKNRGIAFSQLGRRSEARQSYSAAAALAPRLGIGESVSVMRVLADDAREAGEWAVADSVLDAALRLVGDSITVRPSAYLRVTYGRVLSEKAYSVQQRAHQQTDLGIRRALALRLRALADTAAGIHAAHETEDPVEHEYDRGRWAVALIDRAYADAVLGDHALADQHLDQAFGLISPLVEDIFPYALSDYWLRRSETERMAGHAPAAVAAAERSRATCSDDEISCAAEATEQWAAAHEAARDWPAAERRYREAVRMRDIAWERVRLEEWSGSAFSTFQQPYRGLARVLVRQGRAREAFVLLDGARARALRDLQTRQRAIARLTPGRRRQIDSLLTLVHEARVAMVPDTLSLGERSVAEARVRRWRREIGAQTQQRDAPAAPLDVAALQRALARQNRTLVSYLVGETETLIFAVTVDTLLVRQSALSAEAIAQHLRAAGGAWARARPDPAVRLGPLAALYDGLVRPVADLMPDSTGLVVIPDGVLADLPFGMLVEGPPAAAPPAAAPRFLVRSRPVSTDLAAALVAEAPRPASAFAVDLAAFGRSLFDGEAGRLRSRSGPLLANLPNAAAEVRSIAARVAHSTVALDDDATEARFAASAAHARIVHIASHAEADPAFPLNSKIYLWDDPDRDDDGVLHLFELQDLSLPADLVVLSGCSTAAGQAQAGEGTIGLQYGVRAAGARAAVATLWPVDDRATAELVGTFYAGLAKGLPADRALQRAQVAYLDAHTGAEASPYFWAATVLSGNPGPIPLRAPRPRWPWALGLLAAGGLAWRATRRRPAHA